MLLKVIEFALEATYIALGPSAAYLPNLSLKCAPRFHRRPSWSRLLRQLLFGSHPLLSQLLLNRLPHRRHLLARSSLRLRLLLLGFLFGSHTRSLPPVSHS
jgi:hypothetical protein